MSMANWETCLVAWREALDASVADRQDEFTADDIPNIPKPRTNEEQAALLLALNKSAVSALQEKRIHAAVIISQAGHHLVKALPSAEIWSSDLREVAITLYGNVIVIATDAGNVEAVIDYAESGFGRIREFASDRRDQIWSNTLRNSIIILFRNAVFAPTKFGLANKSQEYFDAALDVIKQFSLYTVDESWSSDVEENICYFCSNVIFHESYLEHFEKAAGYAEIYCARLKELSKNTQDHPWSDDFLAAVVHLHINATKNECARNKFEDAYKNATDGLGWVKKFKIHGRESSWSNELHNNIVMLYSALLDVQIKRQDSKKGIEYAKAGLAHVNKILEDKPNRSLTDDLLLAVVKLHRNILAIRSVDEALQLLVNDSKAFLVKITDYSSARTWSETLRVEFIELFRNFVHVQINLRSLEEADEYAEFGMKLIRTFPPDTPETPWGDDLRCAAISLHNNALSLQTRLHASRTTLADQSFIRKASEYAENSLKHIEALFLDASGKSWSNELTICVARMYSNCVIFYRDIEEHERAADCGKTGLEQIKMLPSKKLSRNWNNEFRTALASLCVETSLVEHKLYRIKKSRQLAEDALLLVSENILRGVLNSKFIHLAFRVLSLLPQEPYVFHSSCMAWWLLKEYEQNEEINWDDFGNKINEVNTALIKLSSGKEFLKKWCKFLNVFLIEWHDIDHPHGNFGAVSDEGDAWNPTQTALAALEFLLLWHQSQHKEESYGHDTSFQNMRLELRLKSDELQQRRRARARKLRQLRARHAAVRHEEWFGYRKSWLKRRMAAMRQPSDRVVDAKHWSECESFYEKLYGWVAKDLAKSMGMGNLLADADAILLAVGSHMPVHNGADYSTVEQQLSDWIVVTPAWREKSSGKRWLKQLSESWPQPQNDEAQDLVRKIYPSNGLFDIEVSSQLALEGSFNDQLPNAVDLFSGGDERLCMQLDQAWHRACSEAERLDRLVGALDLGGLHDVCPPFQPIVADTPFDQVAPTELEALLVDALLWQGLDPLGLRREAEVLLAAVFLCDQRVSASTDKQVLKRWQDSPPWSNWNRIADTDTVLLELQRAWRDARPNERLRQVLSPSLDATPSLLQWLQSLTPSSAVDVPFKIAPACLDAPSPVLIQAFRALAQGDPTALKGLLDPAWSHVKSRAHRLVRLKAGLSKGWINNKLRTLLDVVDCNDERCQHDTELRYVCRDAEDQKFVLIDAQNDILCGRTAAFLQPAVREHLQHRAGSEDFRSALSAVIRGAPAALALLQAEVAAALKKAAAITKREPLWRLEPAIARLYAKAVHLHPGPTEEPILRMTLHAWSRAALREALAGQDPDLAGIWSALESSRHALTSLSVTPPDETWLAETAALIRAACYYGAKDHSDEEIWRRGWPPLQMWIQQGAKLRPQRPTVTACQGLLHSDEALVQPFFDPNTGVLKALWLTAEEPLECRDFDAVCCEPNWHDKVLSPWGHWLDGVVRMPGARMWRKPEGQSFAPALPVESVDWADLLSQSPMRIFAETLVDWADAAKCSTLILLLPAPLAQLPWEALPDSRLPGMLVRAVSLSHWRTKKPASSDSGSCWTCYDADSLTFAKLEAHDVDRAPQSTRTLTSVDVLDALTDDNRSHLILHGQYQRFAPLRSGLWVHPDQFLPLWTSAAIGVNSPLVVLSACESNLSGQATDDLLGPVGVGPAYIAAGARAVLGTLWPQCHELKRSGSRRYGIRP
jgi:hypothetical protein